MKNKGGVLCVYDGAWSLTITLEGRRGEKKSSYYAETRGCCVPGP